MYVIIIVKSETQMQIAQELKTLLQEAFKTQPPPIITATSTVITTNNIFQSPVTNKPNNTSTAFGGMELIMYLFMFITSHCNYIIIIITFSYRQYT